jgi:hypothetical protein
MTLSSSSLPFALESESITISLNIRINSIIFTFTQAEPGRIPEPGSLAFLDSALVGFGVFRPCKRRKRTALRTLAVFGLSKGIC